MTDDLLRATISATLAQLRRAVTFGHAPTTPARARTRAPQGQTSAGGIARRAALDPGGSLTERQLQILGVGQPPDRVEP